MTSSIWGVGPAGPIHFGYDSAVLAQKSLLDDGIAHSILFADIHLMMSHGIDYSDARRRSSYYEAVFRDAYGLNARFVRGSDFQSSTDYFTMMLSAARLVTLSRLAKTLSSADEEARNSRKLSTVLYSLMQCLDSVYLEADIVLADWGQKKIYDLLSDSKALGDAIPALMGVRSSLSRRVAKAEFRYYQLMVDTAGRRLNESTSKTRISIHDSSDSIAAKVRGMYAPMPGQPVDDRRQNALLQYLKFSAMPWVSTPVTIATRGGAVVCDSFDELERSYSSGILHPADLKLFLTEVLIERARAMRNRLSTAAYGWIDLQLLGGS